jgi:Protein of unknown function (DUF3574)
MPLQSASLAPSSRHNGRRVRTGVFAILLALAGAGDLHAQAAACPFPDQKPMLVIQLFFGRYVPHRGPVTAAEWNGFLRDHVTPLFPDGFTVYDAYGQWLNPQIHTVIRQPTRIIVFATADVPEVRVKIAEISEEYKRQFRQQSVGVLSSTGCGVF